MPHKSGFVNIIGNPNVGKSTIMNALVGEKLSIITAKAQTTRHRIKGIVNGEDYQIVFSDTPGILDPRYKLQQSMMKTISESMHDADIFLLVVEVGEKTFHQDIIDKLKVMDIQVLVLINKIDLSDQETVNLKMQFWQEILPEAIIIPLSAKYGFNTETVLQKILEKLPESPPFFPKDELTDKPQRFFISEIIREKILLNYRKEVPYSVEVVVHEFKEEENLIRIKTYIYVARETQKIIILGKNGAAIKKLGTDARKDMEEFLGKHVFLELTVKVSKDWRENEKQLKRFGYDI